MAGRTKHQELLCHQLSSQLQSQVPIPLGMLMLCIRAASLSCVGMKGAPVLPYWALLLRVEVLVWRCKWVHDIAEACSASALC